MTDNIRLTPYDNVLAADEISLVKHLKVKLEYGDSDSATQVSELNPLPVALNAPITISNSTLTLSIPNPMTVSAGTVPLSVTFTNTDITADPTGTYTVAGTVTASPKGTYTVSGNVTANPAGVYTVTGNQTVSGSVTANPTGTYTVSGNVTASPAGLYTVTGNQTVSGSVTSLPTGVYTVTNTGTQTVSGTVTANPSGTYTVSGSVTAQPSGTYTVSGSVTAHPSGTYTVSGNVTASPAGLYTVGGSVSAVPSGTYTVTGTTTSQFSFETGNLDSFGRLRVSNPFTIFDSQMRYQDNGKWSTYTTAGGTTTHDANGSLMNLNVNTASGAQVIRETYRVMPYQPGKSLFILTTFTMNAPKTGLQQRVGYFGAQNGIYFEIDGSNINFVLRSYVGGVLNETRVTRGAGVGGWNGDNLDGSGSSKFNITDWGKSFILFIDIEWLGVGDVRVGFVLGGKYILCHTFSHSAASASTSIVGTYMTTACLPLRYEITNLGTTTSSSTLKQICSSVISEGGYQGYLKRFNLDLDATPLKLVSTGTIYPVMSIRLNSSRLDAMVIPAALNILVASNQTVQYYVYHNTTLTSPSWVTHSNGNIDYDLSATGLSGGTPVIGGYISIAGTADVGGLSDFNNQLGRSLAGVSDIITIACSGQSPNTNVYVDFSWYEVT